MYARRPTRPKPQKSLVKKWTAPIAGWVANRALAQPQSQEGPGAAILDNFFPRATSVLLRRGKQRYATLEDVNLPVLALFAFKDGLQQHLFAANENKIYDVTNVLFPAGAEIVTQNALMIGNGEGDYFGWSSTIGLTVADGFTSGDWITTQFATTGDTYLIGVNGQDAGFLYDGEVFYPYVEGGVSRLNYDAQTDPFTANELLTGGTSGAQALIWRVVPNDLDPTTGHLFLIELAGTFQHNEPITDSEGGEATANGVSEVAAPGITFPNGLTTADMAHVWTYKNRLFFAQKESMNAWYLGAVDAVGGTADVFPLAGVFTQGGQLLFGAAWSLDSSGDQGLSEQCVFVSDQGEVAVYRGADPSEAANWSKVGLYRIGTPLGRNAYVRGGGDLAIATTVGLVPLSKAISLDVTALNVATISYKIADAWSDALTLRGAAKWQCAIWPEGKMAVVAPPDVVGSSDPVMFVSNTENGAWARFTGWQAFALETFAGQLFFGSTEGRVFIANTGGTDDGETYTGAVMPLFEDLEAPASLKIGTVARARGRANVTVNDRVDVRVDYDMDPPVAPDATTLSASNTWGTAVWDQSVWGAPGATVVNQEWRSAGGAGYSLSLCYQITSGSIAPIDAELIDLELLYTTAGAVS